MTDSDKKTVFYYRLEKLLNSNLYDPKFKITYEDFGYGRLFIESDKYEWFLSYYGWYTFFSIDVELRYGGYLYRKTFYSKNINITNPYNYFKIFNFFHKYKEVGKNIILKKEFNDLPEDLKEDFILLNRSKKINKIKRNGK